jgi:(1->4)-alpha-D-glucan 1-alpha-D-glucosylmutase
MDRNGKEESAGVRFDPAIEAIIQEILSRRRIPWSTYRLQFNPAFNFRDAQDLLPYLDDLGISDCYASPIFKTCYDQSHGYDICDLSQLNPAIGTQEEFDSFSAALRSRAMGLILDVVPNHMGISGARNIWWMDVLENGPSSIYAPYFDIDWHPVKPELENKVLLPILEDQYGRVLESGKFQLAYEDGAFFIYYYENKLPVVPRTYPMILGHNLPKLIETPGKENEHLQELQSILTALKNLPLRTELDPERIAERSREKEVIKRRIAALYQKSLDIKVAIDSAVLDFNGRVGDPRSFDLLDTLLGDQAYRPAFWRVAADEINYRRFFDVNDLAAIHMESPKVFQSTHPFIFRLLTEGKVTGLRIDHPDGLWNPSDYFLALQENYLSLKIQAHWEGNEGRPAELSEEALRGFVKAWLKDYQNQPLSASNWPLYVVAEKILSGDESLPEDWAVYGTTGYDFLNLVNGLFIESDSQSSFDKIYSHFTGKEINFHDLVNSTKKIIMLIALASEINALSHQLERLSEKNRHYRDFTLNSLTFAMREVLACLPVYRTYIAEPGAVSPRDQAYIEAAVEEAKRRNPRTAEAIFDFIGETLLLRNLGDFPEEEDKVKLIGLVMKFQQITGPVMAKGFEDTSFYTYNRFISLNEVGGQPHQFGVLLRSFHQKNSERQQRWPHSLLTTSTHDTKRSEDVRARLNVLSEIPEGWRTSVGRWSRWNASKKDVVDGAPAPDRNDEYLLYQTLVGAWPGDPLDSDEFKNFRERVAAYMHKATLEAKVHTSWVNPNEEYDAAVRNFVYRILDTKEKNRFLNDLQGLQRWVAYFGQLNSLAQILLKLTSPGVPDIYQGTEVWDLSLVDPDNRRPVDYQRRRSMLADLKNQVDRAGQDLLPMAQELLTTSQDGRIKLYLIYRTLNFRRGHQQLFLSGTYLPLDVTGAKKDHVCTFARILAEETILVVVPRLVVGLTGGLEQPPLGARIWKDTRLLLPSEMAGQIYQNLFTGETLSAEERDGKSGLVLATIFSHFPVALLERIAQ